MSRNVLIGVLAGLALAVVVAVAMACRASAQVDSYPPTDLSRYVTTDDLSNAAATNLNIMAATTPQFVGGSGAYMTLSELLATYPANTANLGKLAHVSDIWGNVSTTLVCESNGTTFYWRPQRTDYAGTIAQTSGTLTLTPLVTPPVITLPSSLTGNMTLSLSSVNAWPGASFKVYAPSTLGLNTLSLSGLVGGGTLPLLQGSEKTITYTAQGWVAR